MSGKPLSPTSGVAKHEDRPLHSKSKYVHFQRDRTSSVENLWHGPYCCISTFLCYRVHSANNRRKFEIGQTSLVAVINKNAGLAKY